MLVIGIPEIPLAVRHSDAAPRCRSQVLGAQGGRLAVNLAVDYYVNILNNAMRKEVVNDEGSPEQTLR